MVHFLPEFWGKPFLALPEMRAVQGMFNLSKQGLVVTDDAWQRVGNLLKAMEMSWA